MNGSGSPRSSDFCHHAAPALALSTAMRQSYAGNRSVPRLN